jgi:outer membrane protein assembly factor BamB
MEKHRDGKLDFPVMWGRDIHSPNQVVRGAKAFHVTRFAVVYVGSEDGKLYAFNAITGATLWTATTGAAVDSSPAVANGVVYVGSYDNKLYAFELNGGTSAVYHRSAQAPSRFMLHPDWRLKAMP